MQGIFRQMHKMPNERNTDAYARRMVYRIFGSQKAWQPVRLNDSVDVYQDRFHRSMHQLLDIQIILTTNGDSIVIVALGEISPQPCVQHLFLQCYWICNNAGNFINCISIVNDRSQLKCMPDVGVHQCLKYMCI